MMLSSKNFNYGVLVCLEENFNLLNLKELFNCHRCYVSSLHTKVRPHYHICFLFDNGIKKDFIQSLCELCKVDDVKVFNNKFYSFKKYIQCFNDIEDKEFIL